MVDTERLLALVPHYLAMLVLAALAVTSLQLALGDVPTPIGFVVVLAIVFLYPFAIRRLGYAPEFWE